MKRFPTLCVLAVLVAVLFTGKYLNAQEDIPCETAPVQSGTNGAAWAKGTANNPTIVTVLLNPNDFPADSERNAVASAFTTWQNANPDAHVVLM